MKSDRKFSRLKLYGKLGSCVSKQLEKLKIKSSHSIESTYKRTAPKKRERNWMYLSLLACGEELVSDLRMD